jgi:hypothetical protein
MGHMRATLPAGTLPAYGFPHPAPHVRKHPFLSLPPFLNTYKHHHLFPTPLHRADVKAPPPTLTIMVF